MRDDGHILIVKHMTYLTWLITFEQAMMGQSFIVKRVRQWLQYIAILMER